MSTEDMSPIGAIVGSVFTAIIGLSLVVAVLLPVIQGLDLGTYNALVYLIGIVVIIGIIVACLAWYTVRSRIIRSG